MLIRYIVLLIVPAMAFPMTPVNENLLKTHSKAYVVSTDDLPTRSCHAATLAEVAPGRLMAAWFGGSQEGQSDVRIWGAYYQQGQWSTPVLLTDFSSGTGGVAHWNPVLFNTGKVLNLHFKMGESPRLWRGFYMTSSDQGKSWSSAQSHQDGFLGPVRNKPVILSDERLIYPSSTEHQGWKVHFELQQPQGPLRVDVHDPQMLGAIQPAILTHPDGRVQALCRTHSGLIAETWSLDNGLSWSEMQPTGLPNPNSGIDAITLRSGKHLLVYNPVVAGL